MTTTEITPNTTIGHLTILSKCSTAHTICLCVCGKTVKMPNWRLRRSGMVSCGCQQGVHDGKRLWKDPADAEKYKQYKQNARKRKREWNITREEFENIIHKPCHYHGTDEGAGGIDRINNDLGYTMDNVVPCCSICNFLKGKANYTLFISRSHQISQNFSYHPKT